MKRARKFAVAANWQLMLADMNIETATALAYARLPADLFRHSNATLSPAEYFRFWLGVEKAADGRDLAMLMAQYLSVEAFDAPIFACICSPDLNTAMQRLSHYKPLVGPMLLDVQQNTNSTRLEIECYGYEAPIPPSLAMVEVVYFTQLVRLATRKRVVPLAVTLPELPPVMEAHVDYLGCEVSQGEAVSLTFSADDAARPFLTANAAMWSFFEDKLRQKLADLDMAATTTERVRAVLLESLPSGEASIDQVASRLAMSKRTLQRKLTAEMETFQTLLSRVRLELADHYLSKTALSLGEISFLLGFQEANSFIRAYSSWKGVSPGCWREQCR